MDITTRIKHLKNLAQELIKEIDQLEAEHAMSCICKDKKIELDDTTKTQLTDLVKGQKSHELL